MSLDGAALLSFCPSRPSLFGTRRLADPARLGGLDPAFFHNVLPQVPRVEPRLHRGEWLVIAFEQQGHGHTADVDRPFSFEHSAEDAVALLRHLHVAKADFLGYSNGGHIALEIVLRHPEVVRSLVLESAFFSRDGTDPGFWEGFEHAKLDDMALELKRAYLAISPHPEQLPIFLAKSVQRMREFEGWTPAQIQTIRAPTLLIVGDRDIVRVEHAVQMQHLISDARLAVFPATDHLAMTDRAAYVASMLDEFL
jgi:pimeloyl-ACP methyl ester carboxylesterase